MVQFSKHNSPHFTIDDFKKVCKNKSGLKWTIADYEKNIVHELTNSNSEWLIIDMRVFAYPIIKITYSSGESELFSENYGPRIIEILKEKNIKFDQQKIKPSNIENTKEFQNFIDFCVHRYGNNIILIETRECEYAINKMGKLEWDNYCAEHYTQIELELCASFLEKTKCHFIKCPYNIISDYLHKWGRNGVHYVEEYYWYCLKSIEYVCKNELDNHTTLEVYYERCCALLAKIRNEEILSVNNSLKRIDQYISDGNFEGSKTILQKMLNQNEPQAYFKISNMYLHGSGFEKNINMAICWLKKAVDCNIPQAENKLFDLLWSINTPSSNKEMIATIKIAVENKDSGAMGRLGKAYHYGRGVEKNLELAAKWLREASECGIGWARIEYLDVLWTMDTQSAHIEMIQILKDPANANDAESMWRLGRAYHYGKGVEKNLELAAKWMRLSNEKNITSAKYELFDILWELNTDDSKKEMISLICPFVKKRDSGAMGRLGRAYRYGKGVEKNLELAAKWTRDAAKINEYWYLELCEILWKIDSDESVKELYSITTSKVAKNNFTFIGWRGRLLKYGKGIPQNLIESEKLLKQASQNGIAWAYKELNGS